MELLDYNLVRAGYVLRKASDGEAALALIAERAPDLVLLDWMLPGVSGIEICRRLRRAEATARLPIVMLTARAEEADRLRGLDTGADDYLVKPFSVEELLARLRAVLRRARPALGADMLTGGDIEIDLVAHRATRRGRALELRPIEFRLLRHFLEHPGRVFSRDQLLDAVWRDQGDIEPKAVDVQIRRLRQALVRPGESDPIRTVRGAGYAFEA
ncbi:MAG: response regulator [Alphaproteobacteria bacterium]|nr:response regulator [Alphaproteobacteria bacterium]